MFRQNNRSITSIFFLLITFFFIIIFLIKYNFFYNYFINIDSAFYVKWFGDLSLTNSLLPSGDNSFYENLLADEQSFFHQLSRRYFNNFSEVYTFFPTIINYFLMINIGPGYITFNTGSIFASSLIPIICIYYIYKEYKLNYFDAILLVIFTNLIFTINFYFFNWSPLGIHNYSLFTLLLSFLIIELNHKKKYFFDLKLVIFAILIPCFSHKFNVPIIFLTLFFIIILRKNYSNNLKIEIFFLLFLFTLVILPLVAGLYFNPKNIAFLNAFFSEGQSINSNQSNFLSNLFQYVLKYIKFSISKLAESYHYSLGYSGIFLTCIALFKSKNKILKFFLLSNVLIFIFLPVATFSLRIFNYQLIIVMMILIEYFYQILIDKKKITNQLILFIFLIFISLNIYKTFFNVNLNKNESNLINVYYKDNQKLKDLLFTIIYKNKINLSNIVFGDYLTKDLFYSYLYEHNEINELDIFPATNSLWNNKDNINYINSLKIDFDKLKNPYFFYIYRYENNNLINKNKILKNSLDKLCELRSMTFGGCGNLKEIEIYIDDKLIKEIFYTGHNYSIALFKVSD